MNVDSALGDMAALVRAELAEFETRKLTTDASRKSVPHGRSNRLDRLAAFRVPLPPAALAATFAHGLRVVRLAERTRTRTGGDAGHGRRCRSVAGRPALQGQNCGPASIGWTVAFCTCSFDGGVMVYVEAPARFDAVSDKRVMLHSGRLSASVPPEGVGFTVETPEAEVVDFGTEFSVDVEWRRERGACV